MHVHVHACHVQYTGACLGVFIVLPYLSRVLVSSVPSPSHYSPANRAGSIHAVLSPVCRSFYYTEFMYRLMDLTQSM